MLTVKAVGSLGDAAAYFEHEMEQDRDDPSREPEADRDAQQQAREAEQREAEAREREAREAQEREAEAHRQEERADRERESAQEQARERESREREERKRATETNRADQQQARDAEQRETETRERETREAEAREREAEARRQEEREDREREERGRATEAERREPDTSWQRLGLHAPDEERSQGSPAPLQGWDESDRSGPPVHIRAGGVSAEELWAAQDRAENGDAAALRADLREQYVAAGLTGREADERLNKLEEMVEKAAKLGEHITIERDQISGELVWNVHNADKAFANDFERLQFADRLKELEHLAAEYGVAFVKHDGPEREMQDFARAPNLREEAQARAGLGVDFSIER